MKKRMTVMLDAPSIDDAASTLQEAIAKRRFILISGRCLVEYKGRSSSKLGLGERILIIKRDGATLVHRPEGCEPVNWHPSGSSLRSRISSDGRLVVTAIRKRPAEVLEISFEEIGFCIAVDLVDKAKFSMVATEEDIQKALLAKPELIEAGFTPISRETNLGDAGFLDILGEDKDGNLVIVEIKRTTIGREAVFQLTRYIEAAKKRTKKPIRGIIAAPRLGKGVFATIQSLGLEFRRISLDECAEIVGRSRDSEITDFFERTEERQC